MSTRCSVTSSRICWFQLTLTISCLSAGNAASTPAQPSGRPLAQPKSRRAAGVTVHPFTGPQVSLVRAEQTAAAGCDTILQLGELNIWPGLRTVIAVEHETAAHDVTLLVVDGNHDDHDQIIACPLVSCAVSSL
ncbi:MAG: hypothetical protein FWF28_02445 [Micrococcales bacterium]|nr:hypothetical protein [Micrococcales bacterium]